MDPLNQMVMVIAVGVGVAVIVADRGCLRPDALAGGPRRDVELGAFDLALGLAVMCLGMLTLAAVATKLGLIQQPGQENAPSLTPQQMVMTAYLSQGVVQLPVVLLMLVRVGARAGGVTAVGFWPRRPGRDLRFGVVALLAALPIVTATTAVVVLVGSMFGQPPPEVGHEMLKAMMEAQSPWVLWAMLASAVVVAPVLEESIFRGFLQTGLLGLVGWDRRWLVVFISAVVFAMVHAGTPWQVKPGLFALGVMLGWLYERTGSLLPGMIVHGGFNAANSAMALLAAAGRAGAH
jgi:CAAX protease family protein